MPEKYCLHPGPQFHQPCGTKCKCYASHSLAPVGAVQFHQQKYVQLYLHAWLENKLNFYTVSFPLWASRVVVNLLAQKLQVKCWWNWPNIYSPFPNFFLSLKGHNLSQTHTESCVLTEALNKVNCEENMSLQKGLDSKESQKYQQKKIICCESRRRQSYKYFYDTKINFNFWTVQNLKLDWICLMLLFYSWYKTNLIFFSTKLIL